MAELEFNDNQDVDLDINAIEPDQSLDIYSPFRVDAAKLTADDFGWKKFTDKIASAPDSVHDILFGPETIIFLKDEIAGKYNLTSEQSAELSRIVRDILLKDIPFNNIASEILNRITSDKAMGQQISNLIVSELLRPVINILGGIGVNQTPSPSLHEQNMGNVVDLRNRPK